MSREGERGEERWEETKGKRQRERVLNRSTEQERATGGRVVGWNEMGRGSLA